MVGKRLGHYEIVEKIGEGGMGEVYRARDTRLDRALGSCSNLAFTASWTQPIQVVVGGSAYPVRTNNWSEASSSPNHGTISNGADIKASD